MRIQEFLANFLNFCALYYTVLLVRCVMISFAVFAVVMLLRKTILRKNVFLKGAVWALFLPVLFVGKMKFFHESGVGIILSWLWLRISLNHVWVCWLYLGVALFYAILLFRERRSLKKMVGKMDKRKVDGASVFVTELPVTPFTIGVLRPKIVIPEIVLKEYDGEELQTILIHEKTHIKQGHLLIYLLWDVLRVLLWLNPLLTIGTKYLREDMEEICDWVTIQKSQGKAYSYGQLLLKSMKMLQAESETFHMYATFAGDKEYRSIRQRVTRITGYKPYKKSAVVGTLLAVIFCVTGMFFVTRSMSYGRNIENDTLIIYGYENGNVTFVDYSDELRKMISYDEDYAYVDREAFDNYLHECGAEGEIFIVFGGFQKLPGIGGRGYSCMYEGDSQEEIVQIPYESGENDWRVRLYKML